MNKLLSSLFEIGSKIFQSCCLFALVVGGLDYFGLIKATIGALTLILTLGLGLAVIIPLLVLLIAYLIMVLRKD